jgi:K+-transporting ATPase A subunit
MRVIVKTDLKAILLLLIVVAAVAFTRVVYIVASHSERTFRKALEDLNTMPAHKNNANSRQSMFTPSHYTIHFLCANGM